MGHHRNTRLAWNLLVATYWVAALVFIVATYELTNDQFGRISPGWQLARFGDVPFRDFLDPGYFLTELATAALQRLLGEQLLGEMLLNAVFIATGAVLVLRLSYQASRSTIIACTAAVLTLLSMPRAYDYDKVLLYPLGLFLCWRYIDRPGPRNLVWLAVGVAVAGLFRYDNGIFIGGAAAVGLIVLHAGDWRLLTRRLGLLVATRSVRRRHFCCGLSGSRDWRMPSIRCGPTRCARGRERASRRDPFSRWATSWSSILSLRAVDSGHMESGGRVGGEARAGGAISAARRGT